MKSVTKQNQLKINIRNSIPSENTKKKKMFLFLFVDSIQTVPQKMPQTVLERKKHTQTHTKKKHARQPNDFVQTENKEMRIERIAIQLASL